MEKRQKARRKSSKASFSQQRRLWKEVGKEPASDDLVQGDFGIERLFLSALPKQWFEWFLDGVSGRLGPQVGPEFVNIASRVSQPIAQFLSALAFGNPQMIQWQNPYARLIAKWIIKKSLELRELKKTK